MQFTNPSALWGLLALAIPILIHLFNLQRYQKVMFTNVRFLQQLLVQAKKQSRLRYFLVLIFRLLALAMLILAFAKPYIPVNPGASVGNQSIVSIYVDNSFSMEAEQDGLSLLDHSRKVAQQIIKSFSPSTRFNLLTNDFEGRLLHFFNSSEVVRIIDEIALSPRNRTLAQVQQRQYDLMRDVGAKNGSVFYISDFQSVVGESMLKNDEFQHFFIPLSTTGSENISLDSCWFETPVQQPGQVLRLKAKVSNHGGQRYEKVPIKLMVNGTQRSLATVDLDPGSTLEAEFTFTQHETGLHVGFLELNDSPIVFDNRLFFSFSVLRTIQILSISDRQASPYLKTLFSTDSIFAFSEANVKKLNYSLLPAQQLVILDGLQKITDGLSGELAKFVFNGGHLLVVPASLVEMQSYQGLLQELKSGVFLPGDTTRTRLEDVNLLHPLYQDVFERDAAGKISLPPNTDFPWFTTYYKLQLPLGNPGEVVAGLRNGLPFLISTPLGEGSVWVLAAPLDTKSTNFPLHALFVPTLHKIALLSTPQHKIYHIIGHDNATLAGAWALSSTQSLRLTSADNDFEIIPGHRVVNYRLYLHGLEQVAQAGNYFLSARNENFLPLSFNYDRKESEQVFLSQAQIEALAAKNGITNFAVLNSYNKPVDQAISELSLGRQLWRYFIIVALLFLLAEGIALRLLP